MSIRLDTLQTRRIAAGFTLADFAKRANVSDWLLTNLEDGGECDQDAAQRIIDALASPVAITSSSVANPSVLTTAAHGFLTGDTVVVAGHAGSTPSLNGSQAVTRITGTSFSVPVDVSVGGTGGMATLDPSSVGLARL